jgi:hypothetical protein
VPPTTAPSASGAATARNLKLDMFSCISEAELKSQYRLEATSNLDNA